MKKSYLSPQAESLEWAYEESFLASGMDSNGIPNLEQEDGWGDSIWN